MNRSIADVGGAMLVVSQFTLYGDAVKGRRPSFVDAARPEHAQPLYERFVADCASAESASRRASSARPWRSRSSTTAPSRSGSNDEPSAGHSRVGVASAARAAAARRDRARRACRPTSTRPTCPARRRPPTPSVWRARRRARSIATDAVIIGSDTIVVVDGDVLGKPRDRDARRRDAAAPERALARRA